MSGGATERIADFDLTPEQRLVRRSVREFAERELLPHVERYEREARYPLELIAKLQRDGRKVAMAGNDGEIEI